MIVLGAEFTDWRIGGDLNLASLPGSEVIVILQKVLLTLFTTGKRNSSTSKATATDRNIFDFLFRLKNMMSSYLTNSRTLEHPFDFFLVHHFVHLYCHTHK